MSLVFEMLGLISLSIGLVCTGVTIRNPAYWFLTVGLIFYVKFGGLKDD